MTDAVSIGRPAAYRKQRNGIPGKRTAHKILRKFIGKADVDRSLPDSAFPVDQTDIAVLNRGFAVFSPGQTYRTKCHKCCTKLSFSLIDGRLAADIYPAQGNKASDVKADRRISDTALAVCFCKRSDCGNEQLVSKDIQIAALRDTDRQPVYPGCHGSRYRVGTDISAVRKRQKVRGLTVEYH